jgi:hypothetical protein
MVSTSERLVTAVTMIGPAMRARARADGAVVGSGTVMAPDTDRRHHRRRGRTSPIRLHAMNTVSPYRSRQGVPAVRHGERDAGSGWWSKRMPGGNRRDRGCAVGNITPRESGPTSTRSLGTRLGTSPSEGGQGSWWHQSVPVRSPRDHRSARQRGGWPIHATAPPDDRTGAVAVATTTIMRRVPPRGVREA